MNSLYRLRFLALLLVGSVSAPAWAAYYQVDAAPSLITYPWIAPGGTNLALADDTTSGVLAMGFTFNFGGVNYTQLRIGSNGWLFFGGVATANPNTALPHATVDTVVMPFWTDLNPNSVATRIQYQTVGVSPNRRFVVSYVNIPHYCTPSSAGTCVDPVTTALTWTFQVQFHETSNDVIFWYNTMGTQGGAFTLDPPAGNYDDAGATIGVEVENGDFTQFSFNTNSVTAGSALRFYYNPIVAADNRAFYHMDETSWVGAGAVIDSSGSGNNATAAGSSVPDDFPVTVPPDEAITTNPGTCGAGSISVTAGAQQVSTPIDPNTTLGNSGTIAFWYSNNAAWNDGTDRMLLDASNELGAGPADKHFYLVKEDSGTLVFAIEDSADANSTATTAVQTFAANTWHHVAVTWNLASDRVRIYLDGALAITSNTNVNGTLGDTATLYLGDQRFTTINGDPGDYTTNSANGYMDEVKIFNRALFTSEVAALMTETHACGSTVDHYLISHDGSMVTCLSEEVTFTAHDSGHVAANPAALTDLDVTTSTSRGTWSGPVPGFGTGTLSDPTPGNPNNGDATYEFPGAESVVKLNLVYTNPAADPESVNFNVVDDNGETEAGSVGLPDNDDTDLSVASTGFVFYNSSDSNTTIPTQIAGKRSDLGFGAKNLALRAIKVSDSDPTVCSTLFANAADVTVQLGAECRNPATCAGQQVTVRNNGNNTAIATNNDNAAALTTTYSNVLLRFAANSTAELHLTYPDAGQMQMHARYDLGNPAGSYMTGSSNTFVERPFGFLVAATGNPAAANENGTVYTAAGEDFTATMKAVGWQSGDDSNDDGIPDGHESADTDPTNNDNLSDNTALLNFGQEAAGGEDGTLTHALNQPAGGAAGTLSNGSITSFNIGTGIGSSTTTRFSEVGIIELSGTVSDGDYLGIGGVDTALARGKSGRVGRFRPFDFNVTGNTPTFAAACDADTTDYTYMVQPFNYATAAQFTVTARNKQNATTVNYDGVWWKLGNPAAGNDITLSYAHDGGALPGGTTLDAGAATTGFNVDCTGGACDGDEIYTLAGPFSYTRTVTPVAPVTSAVDITLSNIVDSDAVAFAGNPFKFENVGFTGGFNQQRWGRLVIAEEAVSDPAVVLDVPVTTEYYNGASFITNADDDCTSFNLASDVVLANEATPGSPLAGNQPMNIGAGTTSVTSGNGLVANGLDLMTFSAPGANNTGLVDITLDLDTTVNGADLPWLFYDWDGDGTFDTTTSGRASFGIITGPESVIYSREPW